MAYDCVKYICPSYSPTYIPTIAYEFRANSVYDPDAEIGGATAVGYVDAAGDFMKYCVMASKIRLEWTPYSTKYDQFSWGGSEALGVPIWAGVGVFAAAETPGERYDVAMVNRRWNWDELVFAPASGYPTQTKQAQVVQKKWFSAKQFYGSDDITDREEAGAYMANHPAAEVRFKVGSCAERTCHFNPTLSDFGCWAVRVHIDYWVQLMEARAAAVPL